MCDTMQQRVGSGRNGKKMPRKAWLWSLDTRLPLTLRLTRSGSGATNALQRLPSVLEMEYLGVHFHAWGTWQAQIAAAAAKVHQDLRKWIPALEFPFARCSEAQSLMTSIAPAVTNGIEFWGPYHGMQGRLALLRPLSDTIDKACRVAMGLHATAVSPA